MQPCGNTDLRGFAYITITLLVLLQYCMPYVYVTAVIKMEGGTDEDLAVLEEPEPSDGARSRNNSETVDKL